MPPLDPAQCPLLRDDRLVERFNAVATILEEAARELPRFGEREIVAEARGELVRLAETMTKKRFEIGFIGPSQIGKSATVRNLLRVAVDEAPTPEGSSGPTTSVPTRTVPRPPGAAAEHAIQLHYFSRAEFLGRVRDICDLVKIRFDEDLRQVREAARTKQVEDPHMKAADVQVLLKLLDAALTCPDVLRDEGLVERGVWADRRLYATHQNAPSRYTLLREIHVEFVTDAISPEIEMIDLPGIDVDKGSDARLTLAFAPRLDGAFMVQSGTQVKSSSVAQLAETMREAHGRTLGERIWMVVTRCDSLNDMQINGPRDQREQPTMFCHLAELMKQQGIKEHNVLFVGNEYYLERQKAGLGEKAPPSAALVARYPEMLRLDPQGRPVVPERCARNAGQVEPWNRLVLDGGIPLLRETMQTKVADAVREQTRRDVSERLDRVIERLGDALLAAEQQSGMTIEEMLRAAKWSGELDALVDDVGRERRYSEAACAAIEGTLESVIAGWGTPSRGGLAENHQNLAGMLVQAGMHEAAAQTDAVAREVRSELERRVGEQPPPTAAGLDAPLEYWSGVVDRYLVPGRTTDGGEFRGPIFRGIREDPNPLADGGQNMTGEHYLEVMRSKAGRVSRVFGTRLVHEIQAHLQRLQARYRALGSEVENIDRDKRERYARYRDQLARLRP